MASSPLVSLVAVNNVRTSTHDSNKVGVYIDPGVTINLRRKPLVGKMHPSKMNYRCNIPYVDHSAGQKIKLNLQY